MVLKQVLTNYFMAFVKLILIVSTAILIKKKSIYTREMVEKQKKYFIKLQNDLKKR